jgi:DNA helicase-2/ATP-dependent DNA helicase PcrA
MLNERQREAVNYTEGPLLILAGAGAGKTKTIVERIIHIIKGGVEPRKILAITFTNKAAKEMRERVQKRMGEEGMLENLGVGPSNNQEGIAESLHNPFSFLYKQMPMIKTFHSLGMYILQEEYQAAGLTKRLTIYDENDSLSIIKNIIEREGVDPKMHEPRRVKGAISRLKSDLIDADGYRQAAFSPFQKVVARIWPQYEAELQKKKVVDFDDLIVKTLKLLQENSEVKEKYQNKWTYLHIDEYQDTNNSQYLLCKLLAEKNKNICAVGDVDQNIYSWRGANLKNLLRFEDDFLNAKIVLLEQNYRSTKNIISAANEIIKKNKIRKEKNLFTENEEGEVITVYTGYDDRQEAVYIAKRIKELVELGIPGKEICVLYRANFQSRSIEQALLAENIPYHVLGIRFFDRKEVKDVMSYLRLAENQSSVEDLKRAISNPSRGFGKVALTKILSGNITELPQPQQVKLDNFWKVIDQVKDLVDTVLPSEIILKIIKLSGMEEKYKEDADEEAMERLGNIYELVTLATEYDKYGVGSEPESGINKFLEEASLISDQDTDTQEDNKVKLMTVHASKGLEFHYVFVTGLEEDLFPSKRLTAQKPTAEESEEERRLFYVALTRARKKLFLTNAKNRMVFGKRQMQFRSEFLDDLPEGLTVEEEEYFGDSSNGGEKIVVYL